MALPAPYLVVSEIYALSLLTVVARLSLAVGFLSLLGSAADAQSKVGPASGPALRKPVEKVVVSPTVKLVPVTKVVAEKKKQRPLATAPSRRMMVPPPPPHIPLIGTQMEQKTFSTLGVPLDYLSKSDLDKMKVRLESSVAKLKLEKEEHDKIKKEKFDRLMQFETLHKEGVVSRRELETAKRELKTMQVEDDDIGLRLDDAETDLSRVNQQLKLLEKRAPKKKS